MSLTYFVTISHHILTLLLQYNFVLSAAWSCGIAISGIIIFFAMQWTETEFEWWGNEVPYDGCEGTPCTLKTLNKAEGEYFGPRYGDFH